MTSMRPMEIKTDIVDSNILNSAALKLKPLWKDFDKQKNAFYDVRDEIDEDLRFCADNVQVVIYLSDVVDEPMVISSGSKENKLRITVKSDGTVTKEWKKVTWTVEKVSCHVLNEAFLSTKHLLRGHYEQETAFYRIRDEIDQDLNCCADNVKVVIYVNNVLDRPIVISSGSKENELRITIKKDGSVRKEWKKTTWRSEKVDNEALIDAFLKIKPFFKGFDKQKFAFYGVRDEINEDVKLCAENVKVEIHVDDVLDNPIIISSGLQENNLKITIKTDGAVMRKWERITWIPEEIITDTVDNEALIDAFLKIKPFFKGFDKQKFAFYCVRNEINEDVKLCAENVKVEIHVDDVLDSPIIISSGLQENNLKITITTDGAVMRKWERITWIPQEFKTEKIDSDDLKGAISKIKPLFKGFANHKKAFDKLQDEFHDNVKTCADNVRVEIHVDKVIERPIVICTERQDNQLRITINEDGNRTTKWEKTTWRKCLFDEWERKKKSASNCMNIEMEKVTSRFFSWVFASVTLEITKKIANYCMRFFEDKFAISESFRSAFQRNLPLFQFFI